jgi:hypothetical protein
MMELAAYGIARSVRNPLANHPAALINSVQMFG